MKKSLQMERTRPRRCRTTRKRNTQGVISTTRASEAETRISAPARYRYVHATSIQNRSRVDNPLNDETALPCVFLEHQRANGGVVGTDEGTGGTGQGDSHVTGKHALS